MNHTDTLDKVAFHLWRWQTKTPVPLQSNTWTWLPVSQKKAWVEQAQVILHLVNTPE